MHNAHLTNDVQLLDVPNVLFSTHGFSVWWIYAVLSQPCPVLLKKDIFVTVIFAGVSWETGNNLFLVLHPTAQCKFDNYYAVSLQECKEICLASTKCTAIDYFPADNLCNQWNCSLPVETSPVESEDLTITSFWLNTGNFK